MGIKKKVENENKNGPKFKGYDAGVNGNGIETD